jgi:hypothetical protein
MMSTNPVRWSVDQEPILLLAAVLAILGVVGVLPLYVGWLPF